ncbi:MAG: hypothetical protein L6N96_02320 [Candidatus Methylarchaceae archaeon HK02M2]|nr:hypothetical protein [Candidatus Methylarchaceae archaeon HK02M2]
MGILNRIKSWFNIVESAPPMTPINEVSPEKVTIETGDQNSKADDLIEAIKVAYEAPSSTESLSTKSETAQFHDSSPKPQQKKRNSRKSKKSVSRSKKKVKEVILKT